jgi:2-polyprenyl-3-methyl-5-hydroxy-6-metoxy-1,4-benzoquinol methylase
MLVYQMATTTSVARTADEPMLLSPLSLSRGQQTLATSTPEEVLRNPLGIPRGQANALPSVRQDKTEVTVERSIYGGAGDKKHLGGFTDIDTAGISPRGWKWMVQKLNIQSVLDVGCGRGISTTWFLFHGLSALCVEGSHDAREKTMLPDPDKQMVEHDFSRGPWWPGKTFDAVWCVEFLEHVSVISLHS